MVWIEYYGVDRILRCEQNNILVDRIIWSELNNMVWTEYYGVDRILWSGQNTMEYSILFCSLHSILSTPYYSVHTIVFCPHHNILTEYYGVDRILRSG
jgi:hypothetical protein